MASCYVQLTPQDHTFDQKPVKLERICVCCSFQSDILININTCEHTRFLQNIIGIKDDLQNTCVCTVCHTMLKKIDLFLQQIEENISKQSYSPKQHNLSQSTTHTTDSSEPIIDETDDVKPTHDVTDIHTDVKIEYESSDNENHSLAVVKKKKGKIDKYEGKIRMINLSLEDLKTERAELAKKESYLNLPFKCEDCIVAFDHENTWKNHMKNRHSKVKSHFQCYICKSVLSNKNSYNEHINKHFRRQQCVECGKNYNHLQSAIHHYESTHLPAGSTLLREPYVCKECGFTTTVNRSFRYHMDKHRHKQDCTICGKTFVTATSLKMHMFTIHKKSSRVYRCDACDKTYRAKSGLVAHLRSAHANAPRAYCTLCRTHYMTNYILQTHLNTHSRHVSDSTKRYICDECGAKFVKKPSLRAHINWEHLKLSHPCSKCSKVFKSTKALRQHVRYFHDKERPPRDKICHHCGRGFTTQAILQSHIRTHTGERPLHCQHCNATFSHSGALYTHIKLKHNVNKVAN